MKKAFTLIEVLISIALLSVVLLALYSALDMQRNANKHLFSYLTKAIDSDKVIMVLYRDIMYSDGNITIVKGEFDRLCINNTSNSLYGLSRAQVCWIVAKEKNKLLRIEGNDYRLPLKYEEHVAIDSVMEDLSLFEVARKKGDILVVLQRASEKPYSFLLQGIEKPPKVKKKNTTVKKEDSNDTNSTDGG